MENQQKTKQPSILRTLRSVIPHRSVTFGEAERIAEIQANRLLELFDITQGPVPTEIVSALPHIKVVYKALPTSGISYWSGKEWVITLNKGECKRRQRFTLMHEFKHIIDHGQTDKLYTGDRMRSSEQQAEAAADYFAGCVLLPRRHLKAAWGNGLQAPLCLANHFEASVAAVSVRLLQTGLRTVHDQFTEPVRTFVNYGRQPKQQRPELVSDGS
ncbi:ImmA/IrrE family metallo-endopeptidase [Kribbella antibiotica]|uniref:ImmA/IrrE family metallo-endopeptidase n=1 Tax=Kribbella antibiotica TaxID=190195 RepID=A0A4R4ZSK4_9ACTN|nr:ImmA/IrrE family metallo-endopeptidase [Kribbella antibiotica]TDD62031.1 ImmA/IrrE family metallo-endopeptidase [Kribbella antibiotica]